jgi:hypothetical protein
LKYNVIERSIRKTKSEDEDQDLKNFLAKDRQLVECSKDDDNRKEYHTCIQNYFCFISSFTTTILFLSFD